MSNEINNDETDHSPTRDEMEEYIPEDKFYCASEDAKLSGGRCVRQCDKCLDEELRKRRQQ